MPLRSACGAAGSRPRPLACPAGSIFPCWRPALWSLRASAPSGVLQWRRAARQLRRVSKRGAAERVSASHSCVAEARQFQAARRAWGTLLATWSSA